MNQNLTHTQSNSYLPTRESFIFPDLCKTAMPSSRNFSDLITKLDLVISPRSTKDQTLSENDQIDLAIDEGSYYYLKIPVKNRPSPLQLYLKKSQGRLIIYSSFTQEKPSPSNYDHIFTSDSFEIRTLDLNFRQDSVYLGLRAVSYTKLSVSCIFGKKINFILDKRLRKKETSEKGQVIKVRSVKNFITRPKSKNFIEENLRKINFSPKEQRQKLSEWEEKRQRVLVKKKQCLVEKKEKALNFINRQKIRREQALLENTRNEAILIKTNQVKDWLVFLYILKVTNYIQEIRAVKRSEKSKKLTEKAKVRTIQRFIRQTTKNFTVEKIVITRSQMLVNLFYSTTRPIAFKESEKMLAKTIRSSGVVFNPRIKFAKFLKKIENIQLSFRKYLGVKAERFRKLIIFWDECKSFQTRRSIKKKSLIHELNISIHQRHVVLCGYYKECLANFYESLRVPATFISQSGIESRVRVSRGKGAFGYMPTLAKMKVLIEKASQVPDRTTVDEDSPFLL